MSDALALECELVLAGRYAALLRAQRETVAPWVWAGILAHADEGDLRIWSKAEATGEDDELSGSAEWREAIAFLADDLLTHVRATGMNLVDLQRAALVPIELDLMREGDGSELRVSQLAGRVLAAVHRHPSRPR
jgi:hypothetical protein